MFLKKIGIKAKSNIINGILIIVLLSLISTNVLAQSNPNKINLNLKGVDLRDAFRALADVADMNIITDGSVKGRVTINLNNVKLIQAVNLLAKTNGLDYKVIENTILVASPDRLQSGFEQKVTKVFNLKNANPQDIKASLNLLVEDSSIRIDKRTNSLIVTAYNSQIAELQELIKDLDQAKKQIVLQARIEEIAHDELEKLGIDWQFGKLSLETNSSFKIGNVGLEYNAALDLLEKSGNASILATPQIATIDGKKASINIGEEVPIVKTNSDGEPKVEFKNVGINLEITPRLTENDKILIKVTPEVSIVSDYLKTSVADYPIISTRKAETNIRVQSGRTIAIGGLIKEEEFEHMSKVPLLGDIPILGRLFQSKRIEKNKQELVIFITPQVVDDTSGEIDSQIVKEFIKDQEKVFK